MILCDLDHLSALRKKIMPSVCVRLYAYSYCNTMSRSSNHLNITWHIFPADLSTKIADIDTTLLRLAGLFRVVSALFK